MKSLLTSLLAACLFLACGGPTPAPPKPPPLQPVSTSDLLIWAGQQEQVYKSSSYSAYYKEALKRGTQISNSQKIAQLPAQAKIGFVLPKGAAAATADEMGLLLKSIMRKPNRNQIIAGLVAAGAIGGVYLLEEEGTAEPSKIGAGASAVPLPANSLSDEQIARLLKSYKMPQAQAEALAASAEQSAAQNLTIKQQPRPARIEEANVSIAFRFGQKGAELQVKPFLPAHPKASCFVQVRAAFPNGLPIKDTNGLMALPDGSVGARHEIPPASTPVSFALSPIRLFFPLAELHTPLRPVQFVVEILDEENNSLAEPQFVLLK
ncbi:hypothetical protein [Phaeodactylibacter luteus]|uniref:Uncharacterized protein n=1 Tax=Phaeodactylibacter luteus TaxID=1564516 RepID=A0A5C6S939_9BACT|nr:hypothetical protein [Phaeodactylibacter luteus]TXB70222.1 hypothetical protein FRY97_00515 [Phaeodactylibacter luteus]